MPILRVDRLGPAKSFRRDGLARIVAPGLVELEHRSISLVHPHLLRGMLDDRAEMLLAAQPLLVSTVPVDGNAEQVGKALHKGEIRLLEAALLRTVSLQDAEGRCIRPA